jgi:DNA-binding response OmpR family regulator
MVMRGLILFADNEVMIRNLVRQVLEKDGHRVLVAADGGEVLELARAHEGAIDLLVTAVGMPLIDGISVYRHIRTACPNLKVLFTSGPVPGQLQLPQSVPFLAKPFAPDTLLTKVNEILAPSRPPAVDGLNVILVVDHDADRRERTRNILTGNGYAVLTAGSVEEAKVISNSIATVDLIVSGVVFPGLSGVALAEHVGASERGISTLLISHFHPDLLRNVAGFSQQPEFLPNPFTPEALLTRVRLLLQS